MNAISIVLQGYPVTFGQALSALGGLALLLFALFCSLLLAGGRGDGTSNASANGGTHGSARAIERGAERAAGDSRRLAGLAPD